MREFLDKAVDVIGVMFVLFGELMIDMFHDSK